MSRGSWRVAVSFVACAAVASLALAWVSATILRLDEAERSLRGRAAVEENIRLALWRMDSALTALIAQESGRRTFDYSAFYPERRAYTRMYQRLQPGEVLLPSPLLTFDSPFITLHFQIDPDGAAQSPQVPEGNMRDLAETSYVDHETVLRFAGRLARFEAGDHRARIEEAMASEPALFCEAMPFAPPAKKKHKGAQNRLSPVSQSSMNTNEWQARARNFNNYSNASQTQESSLSNKAEDAQGSAGRLEVGEGPFRVFWSGSELLMVRSARVEGRRYLQGCVLNWPQLRSWLVASVADLLPESRLAPVAGVGEGARGRLASLPVRLLPGEAGVGAGEPLSPYRWTLVVVWAAVLAATAAVGFLLRGAVALSERRGAFVTAVTHELRTPLTTFQMYTEMLAEGMIPEAKRERYLRTLRREADRLGHLVSNVLAFARLDSGSRGPAHRETLTIDALVSNLSERAADRATQGGLELAFDRDGEAPGRLIATDPGSVEQIVLNLVDNACKYGRSEQGLRLESRVERGELSLKLRDFGPGVESGDQRRIFRPFFKSAQEAATSAPGVGLGLALSRRLARDLGGELKIDQGEAGPGACFELRLPLTL